VAGKPCLGVRADGSVKNGTLAQVAKAILPLAAIATDGLQDARILTRIRRVFGFRRYVNPGGPARSPHRPEPSFPGGPEPRGRP
jgi:hypothetical protein